ncbi:hypothetical protein ACNQPN_29315, partial [Pseudomonas aeruginosa]
VGVWCAGVGVVVLVAWFCGWVVGVLAVGWSAVALWVGLVQGCLAVFVFQVWLGGALLLV